MTGKHPSGIQGSTARIGTSGWQYPDFRGRLYPVDLPSAKLLSFYSERMNAVEINSTFYHFSKVSTYEKWRDTTARDFQVAVKANRHFTHDQDLADPEKRLDEFLSRARVLGPKLGPILFQLPGSFEKDLKRLNAFLAKLPRDLRFTFELRHPSWHDKGVYRALEKHGAAFCVHDIRQRLSPVIATADFAYVRLHGPMKTPYGGPYPVETLKMWARELDSWMRQGIEPYLFFDNTITGDAIDDARKVRSMLARSDDRKAA